MTKPKYRALGIPSSPGAALDEVVDHLGRGATSLGHITGERLEHLRVARSGRDRAVVE